MLCKNAWLWEQSITNVLFLFLKSHIFIQPCVDVHPLLIKYYFPDLTGWLSSPNQACLSKPQQNQDWMYGLEYTAIFCCKKKERQTHDAFCIRRTNVADRLTLGQTNVSRTNVGWTKFFLLFNLNEQHNQSKKMIFGKMTNPSLDLNIKFNSFSYIWIT